MTFTMEMIKQKKMTLVVHLPSRRVSEKYYDSTGTLKYYIHSSPIAGEHIEYLCARDSKLAYNIRVAEEAIHIHQVSKPKKNPLLSFKFIGIVCIIIGMALLICRDLGVAI